MKFSEMVEKVQGTVVVDNPEAEISSAYCGDESVLITVQNHLNAIAVCSLAGIEAVLICHGRPVPDDMKAAAEREGVGIAVTALSQFAAAVALSSLVPAAK